MFQTGIDMMADSPAINPRIPQVRITEERRRQEIEVLHLLIPPYYISSQQNYYPPAHARRNIYNQTATVNAARAYIHDLQIQLRRVADFYHSLLTARILQNNKQTEIIKMYANGDKTTKAKKAYFQTHNNI